MPYPSLVSGKFSFAFDGIVATLETLCVSSAICDGKFFESVEEESLIATQRNEEMRNG